MRHIQRSILLLICLTFLFASFVGAQDNEDLEIAKIKYNTRSEITGIYWSDAKPDWTCNKTHADLKLIKILYFDDESADEVVGLIFANIKGIREQFLFTLKFSDYSTADSKNLQSFLGQGNSYRVDAFTCGAGGNSDPQVFSLEKVTARKNKAKSKRN